MTDLLAILQGMKARVCTVTGTATIGPQTIDVAITLCVAEMERQANPEIQLAIAQGKIEGMEMALNALTRLR